MNLALKKVAGPVRKFYISTLLGLSFLFTNQLAVAQENLPDVGVDGMQAVKSWAYNRISDAESDFSYSGGLRYGSPGFWGNELVYQIFVDRFNNGDPSNDRVNIKGDQVNFQNGPDTWGIYDWRHGGDLQGIIDRLDYINDLGVTSLWITPIMKHDGSYHGYCTTDFTQIDPGIGSNALFREFVRQAHMRNIKVILDVVVNHMCDPQTNYSQQADHYTCAEDIDEKNWNGGVGGSNAQGQLGFSNNFFPPLKSQYFFNRCGANSREDMSGTGPAAIYGDFAPSMFDFDTRNHDFQEIFTDLHKYWIAYADVDGFRLDAVKHVSEDFLAYFSTHIREYAKTIGKDNFYLVGEVAGPADWIGRRLGKMYHDTQNPDNHGIVPVTLTDRIWDVRSTYLTHGLQNFPGMTAAYDFALSGRSRNSLRNEQWISEINNHFTDEYYLTIASQQDARLNLSLLEIHDWPRFVSGAHKNNIRKSELGLGFLATTQGIPITYYGQEQGFNGDCLYSRINAGAAYNQVTSNCEGHDHAAYRQDMFVSGNYRLGSTVASINDLAYIGPTQASVSPDWEVDPFLNREHSVYQTARRFNYIRRSCNALRLGGTFPRLGWNSSEGLLAFSRINGSQEILVVVNNSGETISLPNITVDGGINTAQGQRYINLLNGYEVGTVVKSGQNTYLSFAGTQIGANSVKVFVHENNTTAWDSYIGAHMCTDNPIYQQETNSPPSADAGADIQINPGETAYFNASASTDSDGSIVSYQWSNGLEGVSPALVYNDEGDFEVSLTVTDDDGATDSDTLIVSVRANQSPTANAGPNLTAVVNESVVLDASSSFDPDGSIVEYVWSDGLGEGSTITTSFSESGLYTFTLTVTDDDGASATDSVDIVVSEEALRSNYTVMYARGSHNGFSLSTPMTLVDHNLWEVEVYYDGLATDRFKFDASGNWSINFGGGGSGSTGTATRSGSDIYVGAESGTYLIQFNDDSLVWTKELSEPTPFPPEARAGNDQTVKVGETFTLDASLSSDPNNDIVSYQWQIESGVSLDGEITTHAFTETGVYEVTLTVTDALEFSDSDTLTITVVENMPPVANAGSDRTVAVNESFTLSAAASSDSDGEIVSYQWNHASFGSALTTQDVSISFDEVGQYTISLTVIDNDGASHVDEVNITVEEVVDNWQRTVILIYGRTEVSQDLFFRGGIDSAWSNANRGTQCESQVGGMHNALCSVGIRHLNNLHQYTLPWRTGDNYLDWGKLTTARNGRESGQSGTNSKGEFAEGTPAVWTTNNCASSNIVSSDDLASSCHGNPNLYGGGFTVLNTFGEHYWMLDVDMNCDDTVNGWFEFKSFISNGPGWEVALNQTNFGNLAAPSYSSGNHFAACGKVNVFRRNQNNPVAITEFPVAGF